MGLVATPGRRLSIKILAVNTRYSTPYRKPLNTLEIVSKKLTINKACAFTALLGIERFGPNILLEEAGYELRLRVFKGASY